MTPEDQTEYAEVVCLSFTETEIETLENMAEFYFNAVAKGLSVTLPPNLVLDILAAYDTAGGDESED